MIERDDHHVKQAFEALRQEDAAARRRSLRPLLPHAPGERLGRDAGRWGSPPPSSSWWPS